MICLHVSNVHGKFLNIYFDLLVDQGSEVTTLEHTFQSSLAASE